jgi:hypothetical protein
MEVIRKRTFEDVARVYRRLPRLAGSAPALFPRQRTVTRMSRIPPRFAIRMSNEPYQADPVRIRTHAQASQRVMPGRRARTGA